MESERDEGRDKERYGLSERKRVRGRESEGDVREIEGGRDI
jgi:hypothetical protein